MTKRKNWSKKKIKISRRLAVEIEVFLEEIADVQWDETINSAIEHRWSLAEFMETSTGQALMLSWCLDPSTFRDPEEYILHTVRISTAPEQFYQLDKSLRAF
jgi:hypothetical protein